MIYYSAANYQKIFKELIDFGNPTADNNPEVKSEDSTKMKHICFHVVYICSFLHFLKTKMIFEHRYNDSTFSF